MRNRIVTSIIIIALAILAPSVAGAVNIHGVSKHHHAPIVIVPNNEPAPAVFIHKLHVFYAAVITSEQQKYVAAVAASVTVTQSQPVVNNAPTVQTSGPNGIPAAWWPTALCEEGGNNSPTFGYFGIMPSSWNGYQGYSTAGAAPLSVQLAWEAAYIGGPPDAPGQCHSY